MGFKVEEITVDFRYWSLSLAHARYDCPGPQGLRLVRRLGFGRPTRSHMRSWCFLWSNACSSKQGIWLCRYTKQSKIRRARSEASAKFDNSKSKPDAQDRLQNQGNDLFSLCRGELGVKPSGIALILYASHLYWSSSESLLVATTALTLTGVRSIRSW